MEFDKGKYKVMDAKSIEVIHWKINPLMAISELALGHRIPEVLLIDKTANKPLLDRGFVPCPHCHTLHDSRTWSQQNHTVYKNWYGYYCPQCEQVIPCVRNWTAGLILGLLRLFRSQKVDQDKAKWLAQQPQRFENLTFDPVKVNWMKIGLKWGFFMFLAFMVLMPALFPPFVEGIEYEMTLNPRFLLYMAAFTGPLCTLGGLLFGFLMQKSMEKRGGSQPK